MLTRGQALSCFGGSYDVANRNLDGSFKFQFQCSLRGQYTLTLYCTSHLRIPICCRKIHSICGSQKKYLKFTFQVRLGTLFMLFAYFQTLPKHIVMVPTNLEKVLYVNETKWKPSSTYRASKNHLRQVKIMLYYSMVRTMLSY